jgi:hypothetical protein
MPLVGRSYDHFKGTRYVCVCRALDSETQELMIVYTVAGSSNYWVRPAKMFTEEVTWPDGVQRPRFVLVDD